MTFDLSKLSPAPWFLAQQGPMLSVCSEGQPIIADMANYLRANYRDDAEFIALARNVFDIMVRRGWWVAPLEVVSPPRTIWFVVGGIGTRRFNATDPFSALIAADKWYREHVECKQAPVPCEDRPDDE